MTDDGESTTQRSSAMGLRRSILQALNLYHDDESIVDTACNTVHEDDEDVDVVKQTQSTTDVIITRPLYETTFECNEIECDARRPMNTDEDECRTVAAEAVRVHDSEKKEKRADEQVAENDVDADDAARQQTMGYSSGK